MKPRRYRLLKSPAPTNSARWRCSWLDCAHGMGLAGMGRCAARGEWWNPDCPEYENWEVAMDKFFKQDTPVSILSCKRKQEQCSICDDTGRKKVYYDYGAPCLNCNAWNTLKEGE